MKNKIAVIIVLYKNNESNYLSLSDNELFQVFLIDNTPNRDLNLSYGNIHYIPLNNNYGIAYAQNIGISKAIENGCKYIIFFDQDSTISESLITSLCNTFKNLSNNGIKVGAIGPVIVNRETNKLYKSNHNKSQEFSTVDKIISSGCLTSIEVLEDVGAMEADLFIDLVDFEWCWRLAKYGYSIWVSSKTYLEHQLGKTTFTFCCIDFNVTSPIRYKYTVRNSLLLMQRSYVPKKWKMKILIKLPMTAIMILCHPKFSGQRKESIKNFLKGLVLAFKQRK